jgi:GTP pyrophosphokinase
MSLDKPSAQVEGPITTDLGDLGLPRDWSIDRGLDRRQAEALRKMFLAIASDPRRVLARLEQQLSRLRAARTNPGTDRERLALETRLLFAPLANRLGAWNLKWQLEDFALRYLEPEEYHRIAAALHEKRADRERYIETLRDDLRSHLAGMGIAAEVYGRAKHIYSIHRKMQQKQLPFEKVFDVRAVRIIVSTVAECYAALGLVHGLWPHVPSEFDDYIATPKANSYRSIHTAVSGPQGKSVEIQIRTRAMHEQAELGGAPHWKYKEGGARDLEYERKIEWVRRFLAPDDSSDAAERDLLEQVRAELFSDRVYALTPKGEVIELPRGATPLDFAYHLHTDLGHRCRGAKVNGRIVPLTHQLLTGEVVEIIAGKQPAPSRHWMEPAERYLASARNRAKVRAWFKKQEQPQSTAEPEKPGEPPPAAPSSAEMVLTEIRRRPKSTTARPRTPVDIEGVGDLPTTLARCCRPIRPQPVTGYVTLGRGVTIHRSDCASLMRMRIARQERVLRVAWTSNTDALLTVELVVLAADRPGLVRDVADVVVAEQLSIETLSSMLLPGGSTARIAMKLGVRDVDQLGQVLRRMSAIAGVTRAWRSN